MGDPSLTVAGFMHDICKFDNVRENKKTGWPTSPGHELAAGDLVRKLHWWITSLGADTFVVANLCEAHMLVKRIGEMRPSKVLLYTTLWREQGIFGRLLVLSGADDMLTHFWIAPAKF